MSLKAPQIVMSKDLPVKKLISRKFSLNNYETREELIDGSDYGGKDISMKSCFTPNGDFIGDPKTAKFLTKVKGLTYLQPAESSDSVCSIGFRPADQKWYGWSHRAMAGFGIGDKLFDEKFGDDNTPFNQHGEKTIESLEEAKRAAVAFAKSVS